MSNRFDPDLGWHLRFGKEAFEGYFSFNDSYTWGNFNWPWINHEWGGDLLYWLIYSNFGYGLLLILTSVAAFGGYILSSLRFNNKISAGGLLSVIILSYSAFGILIMRLATLTVLFYAILLYSLAFAHQKNWYYWWPILFWIWSIIHGSWFIGITIACVYWSGMVVDNLFERYLNYKPFNKVETKKLIKIFASIIISLLVVTINPYGFKLAAEVLTYFKIDYFKTTISEWTASCAFPIYLAPIIFIPILLTVNFNLWRRKKITTGELLVSIMLSVAAIKYRRQWLAASLALIPTLGALFDLIIVSISNYLNNKLRMFLSIIMVVCLLLVNVNFFTFNLRENPWSNEKLIENNNIPFLAINYLKNELPDNSLTDIFNEYNWGGYMNWAVPEARVFIDGRGSGTWLVGTSTPFLKVYHNYLYNNGGLNIIENSKAKYVLLKNYVSSTVKISWLDRQFYVVNFRTSTELSRSLDKSQNWEKIYIDNKAVIWRKK